MTREQMHKMAVDAGFPECANAYIAGYQEALRSQIQEIDPKQVKQSNPQMIKDSLIGKP